MKSKEYIKEFIGDYNNLKIKKEKLELELEEKILNVELIEEDLKKRIKRLDIRIRRIDNYLKLLNDDTNERAVFFDVVINNKSVTETADKYNIARRTATRKIEKAYEKIGQLLDY